MAPTLADSLSTPPCGEECRLLVHKVYISSLALQRLKGWFYYCRGVSVYISEIPCSSIIMIATHKGMYSYSPPQFLGVTTVKMPEIKLTQPYCSNHILIFAL